MKNRINIFVVDKATKERHKACFKLDYPEETNNYKGVFLLSNMKHFNGALIRNKDEFHFSWICYMDFTKKEILLKKLIKKILSLMPPEYDYIFAEENIIKFKGIVL